MTGVLLLENRRRQALQCLRPNIRSELLLGSVELHLDLPELVLKNGDESNATVHRVPQPRLRFIRQGLHRIVSLRRVELVQQLGHVAGTENLVHISKPLRVVRRKVRREHALLRALPPQKLARRARRIR